MNAEQECHEEVSRRGELQPCNKTAVAYRKEPTFGGSYPVCAFHARADMVALTTVKAAVRADAYREFSEVMLVDGKFTLAMHDAGVRADQITKDAGIAEAEAREWAMTYIRFVGNVIAAAIRAQLPAIVARAKRVELFTHNDADHTSTPEQIAEMIERSSLGTPGARALRATISDERGQR